MATGDVITASGLLWVQDGTIGRVVQRLWRDGSDTVVMWADGRTTIEAHPLRQPLAPAPQQTPTTGAAIQYAAWWAATDALTADHRWWGPRNRWPDGVRL